VEFSNFSNSQIFKFIKMTKKADFVKGLHGMSDSDLQARLNEDKLRLKKLKFAHAISPLENPMTIRGVRREIARLKSELKKREQGA